MSSNFPPTPIRLGFFMTRGMSLEAWERNGLLDREAALYRRLQADGVEVGFVTYGGPEERNYASHLSGMRILCNHWRLAPRLYERLLPCFHARWLLRCDVVKSNQVQGAMVALQAARLWRKPLVVRSGYLLSDFQANSEGNEAPSTHAAFKIEEEVFSAAQRIVVTSPAMAATVGSRIAGAAAKTSVIPNYVDTELFRPDSKVQKDIDVLFVGRLAPQKNIEALLAAVARLDVGVTMVGDGPKCDLVENARARLNGRLQWIERVDHSELPALMRRARAFILPSLWEGHPKTLIEAMACGVPVIGGDVAGIHDLIRHGEDGWLCDIHPEAIGAAIEHILTNPEMARELGRKARSRASAEFSLDRIAKRELSLLRETVVEWSGR
ncbi:MAG: glycosyltransferase family 4 protein [Rhodospirillales bacterium]|jgi:glycosyltransferase involved in cell wall biosynthesis|nr:glycosyltransferase family 4 protein [Rhodospirillales bacterium]